MSSVNRLVIAVGGVGAACTLGALAVGLSAGSKADVALTAATATPLAALAPSASTLLVAPHAPQPVVTGTLIADDGASDGPVTGGTTMTVTGEDLATVASASFGGNPGAIVAASADSVTLTSPASIDLSEGTVSVQLFDAAGVEVPVGEPSATVSTASAGEAVPLEEFAQVKRSEERRVGKECPV